ncbi:MAG TPA: hypothetical protein VFB38_10705 [Chthonomonadaceae bacterium]|nr:hypothetical protein [Chthonomonadaceae bacterium]
MSRTETPKKTERLGLVLVSALGIGFAFALVYLLIGLRYVAIATLPHILTPGDSLDFQGVIDGLPVPRLLDWNLEQIEWLMSLRGMDRIQRVIFGLLLFGALWLLMVFILNPTFRLFHFRRAGGAAPDRRPTLQPAAAFVPTSGGGISPSASPDSAAPTPETRLSAAGSRKRTRSYAALGSATALLTVRVETGRLGKALLLLLAVGLPLLAVRWALARPGSALYPLWLAACGAAIWLAFRPEGWAGDFASTRWGSPGRALPGLLLCGALFGLGLYALMRWALPGPLEGVLLHYQTLGAFNRAYWNEIAGRYLFRAAASGFAAGTLFYLLGRPGLDLGRRGALLALPLLAAAASILARPALSPAQLAARFDLTPEVVSAIRTPWSPRRPASGVPEGRQAGQVLARLAHLPHPAQLPTLQSERSLLLFHPRGLVNARQSLFSDDGLSLDRATVQPVQDFLRQRGYKTALSWVAIRHLFNVGAFDFNPTAELQACLLDLANCPHPWKTETAMRIVFFVSAVSPENLALAEQLEDPARFAWPDRDSLRMMGDLFNRAGALRKAEAWYRRAEMPRSFFTMIHKYPVFHEGRVLGTLRLNGQPLAGVRVGLVPKRLNGLPHQLQPLVLDADREVIGGVPDPATPFRPFHPPPFALRWISAGATTDAQGGFALENLVDGEYFLLVALPPTVQLRPPLDPALQARGLPGSITVNSDHPTAQLGTIDLNYSTR